MKKHPFLQALFATASSLLAISSSAADLQLTVDGKPRAVIVTADAPSAAARKGAALLAAQIERISGAKLPVVKESALGEVTVERGAPAVFVLIGESALATRLGANSEGLGAGSILLRTFANALVLLGPDEKTPSDPHGTRYAVTTFLEDTLGCRMLWPGELGLVTPRRQR